MSKILYLAEHLEDGGTAKHVAELAPRLRAHGIEPTILSRGLQGAYAHALRNQGVEVIHSTHCYRDSLRALSGRKYALVHSLLYGPHLYDVLIAYVTHIPYVRSTRNMGHWNKPLLRIRTKVALRAKLVKHHVANSVGAKEYLVKREKVRPDAIHVIPNGIVDRRHEGPFLSREELGLAPDDLVMISVAWLKRHKFIDFLIDRLPEIQAFCQKAKLLLVGTGPLEQQLKQHAHERGVSDACLFVGRQSNPHAFLRLADVAVSASPNEGMSNALLEAQMMAVPAVVTEEAGGNREVIRHGVNGLLYPALNAPAFRAAIASIIQEPGLRTKYGTAARHIFETHFTLEIQVRRYVAYYESVMNAPARKIRGLTEGASS